MKCFLSILIATATLVTVSAYARENPDCSDDFCEYRPKYFKFQLTTFKNSVLWCAFSNPNPNLGKDDFVRSGSEAVEYRLADRARFERCLVRKDVLPSALDNSDTKLKVLVQVFAIQSGANNSLNAGIGANYTPKNPPGDLLSRFTSTVLDSGIAGLTFTGGNLASTIFKLNFDFGRKKSWSTLVNMYDFSVEHGQSITYNMTKQMYLKETLGNTTPVSAKSGLVVNFTPYLAENGQIKLQDFNVVFASETDDKDKISLVETFDTGWSTFVVKAGASKLIASKQSEFSYDQKSDSWIFARGSSKNNVVANTYIVVTPFVVKDDSTLPELKGFCPVVDSEMLPAGDSQSKSTILNQVDAGLDPMFSAPFGQSVFLYSPERALDKVNVDQSIQIDVFDENFQQIDQTMIRKSNCLAKSKIYLPAVNFDKFCSKSKTSCENGSCSKSKTNCERIRYYVKMSYVNDEQNPDVSEAVYFYLDHEPGSLEVSHPKFVKPFGPAQNKDSRSIWEKFFSPKTDDENVNLSN